MNLQTQIFLFLTALLLSIGDLFGQQKTEIDLVQDIQNRITLNHENGEKELFHLTTKPTKAKPQNLYYWYHGRQLHQSQGGYSGKLLDGTYTKYYSNKQLARQGQYKKGLATGWWKDWRLNSSLSKQAYWKNGRQHGMCKLYDEQGRLIMSGKQDNGNWQGKVMTYSKKDSIYTTIYYDQGKEISKDAYVDSKLLLRTGRFFSRTWNNIFHKKRTNSAVIENQQPQSQ